MLPVKPFKTRRQTPFYFFMTERAKQLELSPQQTVHLVGHEWDEKTPKEKEVYKEMADAHNAKRVKGPAPIIRPPSPIEENFREMAEQIMGKYKESDNTVLMRNYHEKMLRALDTQECARVPFILLKFSTYLEEDLDNFLVGEVGMTSFCLADGIMDNFASLVDPGVFKKSFVIQVTNSARKCALPMPNYDEKAQNYGSILNQIFNVASQYKKHYKDIITFHVMQKEIIITELCLNWLIFKSKQSITNYKYQILPLDPMICILSSKKHFENFPDGKMKMFINVLNNQVEVQRSKEQEGFPYSATITPEFCMAKAEMKKRTKNNLTYPPSLPFLQLGSFSHPSHLEKFFELDNYLWHSELACHYHQERGDGINWCPLVQTNRYAFCIMDVLFDPFKIPPVPGRHYPEYEHVEKERRHNLLMKWELFNSYEISQRELENDKELISYLAETSTLNKEEKSLK